jgi:hypothetical protein
MQMHPFQPTKLFGADTGNKKNYSNQELKSVDYVQFQIKRHLCYWGTLPEPDLSFMPLDL